MCTEMPRTVALRDVIFQIVQVARERADVANTVLGERLIEQLHRAVLTIVFAGQYSRGKTSLINALVGMDLLPTGILPVTMVSTVVAGGPVAAAHVVYVDGRRTEIGLGELAQTITTSAYAVGIRRVEVQLPSFRFADVELVDAPGIGTPADPDGRGAAEALRLADLAVLVVGPEPPITAPDLAFAAVVHAASERLFVVINKADLAGDDLGQVLQFTADRLRERLGAVLPIYALDARSALRAVVAGTTDPQFARFLGDLEAFITRQGIGALAASIKRRAGALADQLADAIAVERVAIAAPRSVRLAAVDRLQALHVELRERRYELESGFAQAVATELRVFDTKLETEIVVDRATLRRAVEAAAQTGDFNALSDALEVGMRPFRECWHANAEAVLRQLAAARLRRLFAALGQFREDVLAAMHQAFAEPFVLRAAIAPPEVELPAIHVGEDFPTTGIELALHAGFRALPRAARAARLRATLEERIAERFDRERGRLLAAMRQAFAALTVSTTSAVDRWSETTITVIARAVERAASIDESDVTNRITELSNSEGALRNGATLLRSDTA